MKHAETVADVPIEKHLNDIEKFIGDVRELIGRYADKIKQPYSDILALANYAGINADWC